MNNLAIRIIFIFCSFLTMSCHSHSGKDNHAHESESATHEHDNENQNSVGLTEEQMKSINIEMGYIEKKQLTNSLKANGILKVPNQNRAQATSLLGGVVKSILVQTGNFVKKGQTIAIISNNSFIILQEEYLTVSAKAQIANIEFDRQKTLIEGNASSQKMYQQAESEYKSLQAKKISLQKQLEQVGIKANELTAEKIQSSIAIPSPIDGSISNVIVNIGTYVEPNNPIAEIVDNSQLHLDLYVYEKDLLKLKVGQTIHFTLTNNPGKEYDADVYAISNTFEPNTKAVSVHATVKGNKQGLIDGMNITALVSLNNATVDAVPTEAIVSSEGQDYIFAVKNLGIEEHSQDKNEHNSEIHSNEKDSENEIMFEKIPIRKGTTDVGYSEITLLKALPKDAKIVVKGAFFILAKMTNQGEAHEH